MAECTKTVPLICESIRKAKRGAGDSSESLDKLPENYYNGSRCCIGVSICICACAGFLLGRMPDSSGKVQMRRSTVTESARQPCTGLRLLSVVPCTACNASQADRASTKEATTKFYERGKKECISRKAEQFSPLFSQQQWHPAL
jgi:hypothetical protein